MRFFFPAFFAAVLLLPGAAFGAMGADPAQGLWYSLNKEGGIEIYPCGDLICGRAHWLSVGPQSLDIHNPDPALRSRPLCGLDLLTGFKPDGQGNYTDGRAYDPKTGSTYQAQLKLLAPDRLEIHGYILLPVLGLSQTWERAATMPDCAAGE